MLDIKDYYTISSEYNAFDIPRMISKKATDKIRSLTSNTAIRIDNLDKLIGFYTGKLTTIGEFVNILDPLTKAPGILYRGIAHIIRKIRDEKYGEIFTSNDNYKEELEELPKDKKELSSVFLSYYQFFINIKNIKWDQPSNYKNVNVVTHNVISQLLDTSLNEQWRDATPLELHNLKLFKPDKIKREMEEGMKIMETESEAVGKSEEWHAIYSVAAKDANKMMDFILSNISDTHGVVKFKE